jgi:HEPN domain-containing protein
MARRRFPPDDPREWLSRARSNLVLARKTSAVVYLEDNCFNAQQAAEKAIKAIFIHRSESFPYIHNLEHLLKRPERNGLKIPKLVHMAHELTRFASELRYPGTFGPVSEREHRHFVRIAEAVLRWAERQIGKP